MAETPTTAATTAPAPASGGLPQFDTAWWPGEMVWFLIIFGVVFALMAKVFTPRIGGTIAEREDRIAEDIAQARQLKEQAEAQSAAVDVELAEARATAQRLIAQAKGRAEAQAAAALAAEEAELAEAAEAATRTGGISGAELAARKETLAAAEARIRAARDEALANVRSIAAVAAQAMVAKLTGQPASSAEVERALAGQG
jgi:F-type H+-transporting ATPase subunit b